MPWGVAAAAVVSAGAGIYDQNQAINAQKSAIAPLQGAQSTAYSKATDISNTPYTPYTGVQVAPITGSQQQAITQATTDANNNEAGGDLAKSEGLAGQIAGNSWNTATAAKYMNPYTQNVTDVAQKQLNQQYANTISAQNANAASTGAFGGDRSTLTNENTTGQYLYQSGNLAAVNQAKAYDSAIQAWQADNSRAASAATSYQNSANDVTQMNASQIKDLLATGGVAQATQQMQLNANYNDYLDQRNWSTTELQPLLSAIGGKGTPANPTPANKASDLLGMGSALAGYFGSSKGNNNNNSPNMGSGNSAPIAGTPYGSGGNTGTYSNYASYAGSPAADSSGFTDAYCDYGLKKNVEPYQFDGMSGLQVYRFHYATEGDDEAPWLGYMAQEVREQYPDAVYAGAKGFLKIKRGAVPSEQTYPVRVLPPISDEDWATLDAMIQGADHG